MNDYYLKTVALLLDVLPEVFRENCFVLKGGTAINLFVRNMPRLSVDIDVTYANAVPSRNDALADIQKEILKIEKRLSSLGMKCVSGGSKEAHETKLFVRRNDLEVKIEVNFVLRGTVLPAVKAKLVPDAQRIFSREITLPVLDKNELYAGKIVAALDRQHPRDIFDVMMLFKEKAPLAPEMMDCFVCYLISHDGSLPGVLFSKDKDLTAPFESQFKGMAFEDVSASDLNEARKLLRGELAKNLTPKHKEFLLGFASCNPDWSLLPYADVSKLPAIQWKIQNLEKLRKTNPAKFRQQAEELETGFSR